MQLQNGENERKIEKRVFWNERFIEKDAGLEEKKDKIQAKPEYWMEEEHMDMEKSDRFEQEADEIYGSLYRLFDQAAERIVSTTSGQIDKITAMKMIRCRRKEVERIFA